MNHVDEELEQACEYTVRKITALEERAEKAEAALAEAREGWRRLSIEALEFAIGRMGTGEDAETLMEEAQAARAALARSGGAE